MTLLQACTAFSWFISSQKMCSSHQLLQSTKNNLSKGCFCGLQVGNSNWKELGSSEVLKYDVIFKLKEVSFLTIFSLSIYTVKLLFFYPVPTKRILLKRMYAVRWSVFLKLCCREGSAFGSVISVAIDLFFISKCDMVCSQTFFNWSKKSFVYISYNNFLQNETNYWYSSRSQCFTQLWYQAKVATELWFLHIISEWKQSLMVFAEVITNTLKIFVNVTLHQLL